MLQTITVEIDANGHIQPLTPIQQLPAGRAVLTLSSTHTAATLLAEPALAEDWLKSEEDAAWAHLQPGK